MPRTPGRFIPLAALGIACAALAFTGTVIADDPETISIWPGDPPGRQSAPTVQTVTERSQPPELRDRFVTGITDPRVAVFRPDSPDGTALLILPGGGYQRVVLDKEGYETAEWLAVRGITAFVLTYRLPGETWTAGPDTPLQDTQRALRWVRHHAAEFGIDSSRIGVIGFSAGGHAAATLLTRYDAAVYEPVDAADRVSARPDFGALVYPVISMRSELTHAGSRERLLGPEPNEAALAAHSPELHVNAATPPTFLIHAGDDEAVLVGNSLVMYTALRDAGAGAELHVFAEGGHGFGLRHVAGKPVAAWPELLLAWVRALP